MAKLVCYNLTASPVTLAIPDVSIVIPASAAPPARGEGVNVTSEMQGLLGADYTAIEVQRAAGLEFEWEGLAEYEIGTVQVSSQVGGFVGGHSQVAAYQFVWSDQGKLVHVSNAGALDVTIPPHATVAYPLWTVLAVEQSGAGQLTMAPGAGVTLNFRLSAKTAGQYAIISAVKTAINTWTVFGDVAAS